MYGTGNEGVFIPWLSDPDLCVSCGRCAAVCSSGGIILTSFVEEARMRFLTKRPKGLIIEDEK
ncbi:MAG: 4Fe-4S binding protein, partial [Nitrospirae bacterium]|nr:4Fe-4S binding protein [Nitrospirota bacterium]